MDIRVKAGLETLKMLGLATGAVLIVGKTLQLLVRNFTPDQLVSGFVVLIMSGLIYLIYSSNLSRLRWKQDTVERNQKLREIRSELEKLKG
jgi:hypothetical protein